jgi:3-keto-5-aminohexanoate cleavage enzyme
VQRRIAILKKGGIAVGRWEIVSELLPERVAEHFPVDREPPIETLSKPVIIESAYPGWQIGGDRFPAVPRTIEEQVREIIDSVRAGAVAIHVHPRDPRTGNARIDPILLKEVLDPVFEEVDCVTLQHTWAAKEEADYISETAQLLELGGGNKYCQGAVVLPIGYTSVTGAFHSLRSVQEGVRWLEDNKVKPIYQLYDSFVIFGIKQHLLDTGISRWKPYVFNLHLGKHHSHAVHRDPWSFLNLIANYHMVQSTEPESIVGVYPGGRNWLPILTLGLLLGAQLVRVGIEDCYWVYPHRNEIIRKNSDVVEMAVQIATVLGRRVVRDADEARSILGIVRT